MTVTTGHNIDTDPRAAREAAWEARREEARRRHLADLAARYPGGVPPEQAEFYEPGQVLAFHGSTSGNSTVLVRTHPEANSNFTYHVEKHMKNMAREIQPWFRPVGDFREPEDWTCAIEVESLVRKDDDGREYTESVMLSKRGERLPPDLRVERRVDSLISDATEAHRRGKHAEGWHPWCEECELRFRRCPWSNNDITSAWATDEMLCEIYRPDIEARVRGLLIRDGGRIPNAEPKAATSLDEWRTYSLDDLENMEEPAWLVEGLVPTGGLGYLTGRDGTYKTFFALDLALHLASGEKVTWNGRPMEEEVYGGTLFLAGEGMQSFKKRISAWKAHHGGDINPDMFTAGDIVNVHGGGEAFERLVGYVQDRQPDLLIIDTLNRAAGQAEQNSASDMSVFRARLQRLQRAAGERMTILVVAHTDKGDNDARGSSAIEDDADFVLHAKKDDGAMRLKVAKMKDGPSGHEITLAVVASAESVVLVEQGVAPGERVNATREDRVVQVLFNARHDQDLTAKEISQNISALWGPGSTNYDSARSALTTLVREGKVDRTVDGKGDKPSRYALSAEQVKEIEDRTGA